MAASRRASLGIFVAVSFTLVGVLAFAVTRSHHVQWTLLGMAVALYLIPATLIYTASFWVAEFLDRLLSTRSAVLPIAIAGCLPALVPIIVMQGERDMPAFALGMLPGGLVGAAIAFWPQKSLETDAAKQSGT